MKKSFWILTTFATISSIGASMIMPYIPIYGREIGMSVGLVGFLVFVFYGTDTSARIPLGSLAEKIGYHNIVLFGGLSLLLASLLYLVSTPFPKLLFIAQMCFGLGFSMTWVTIPSFITITDGSISKYSFFVGVGWLLGPPLGGYIKDYFNMYMLFQTFLMTSISLVILTILFYKNYLSNHKKKNKKQKISELLSSTITSFKKAYMVLKKGGRVFVAIAVSFIMFMTFSMAYSLVPLYFEAVGLISFQIGIMMSIRGGFSTVIKLAVDKVLQYLDGVTVLTLTMVGTGIPIILISITESVYIIALLSVMWGLFAGMYFPIVLELIAKGTTKKERGIAMGLRGTVGTMGSSVGVLVFSTLAENFSLSFSLQAVGVSVMIFAFVLWMVWKYKLNKN